MEPVKVVYLMAYGRSGSTIVGNILNEIDGFVHVGELRHVWARTVERRLCGCTNPVPECPLWSKVVPAALDETGHPMDLTSVMADLRSGVRIRYLRQLLRGAEAAPAAAVRYQRVLTAAYHRIADVTGSRVIVDSSKRIADAALLGWDASIEPYFVQLVRDPRAVAYSWRRHKSSPGEEKERLHTQRPSVTARSWSTFAAGASFVRRKNAARSSLIRYEDFAAGPRKVVENLVAAVGETPAELPFLDDHTVVLGPNHTVGGNPVRFNSGATVIRNDDEWVRQQPDRDRNLVTAITLPLLLAYGYPVRPA